MEQLYKDGLLTEEEFTKLKEKKQPLSDEEKRQRQNEYAKNYYQKNKEKIRKQNLARYYKTKLS